MKIGWVGNIPPPVGGAEVFLDQFLAFFVRPPKRTGALVRWRKQIFLYLPERLVRVYAPKGTVRSRHRVRAHYLFEVLERPKFQRRALFDEAIRKRYAEQGLEAAEIFRTAGVRLVHAHMLFPNLFFAAVAAKTLRVPLVATIHGMLEFRILDRFAKRYPRFAAEVRRCVPKADVVVAVSREIAAEARRRGARRVVLISGGIDTERFRPRGPRRAPRKDLLFVGTVRQDKGAALLIRAFERIQDRVEGRLIFIGNPILKGKIMERAGRNPRIRFEGVQPAERLRQAYARARLMILPSRNEGLSLSVLEAMASGAPVLATATGELTRLIRHGENGFLLPQAQRTPRGLAEAIEAALCRSDTEQLSRSARRAALGFDIRAVVRRYEALYRSLLS